MPVSAERSTRDARRAGRLVVPLAPLALLAVWVTVPGAIGAAERAWVEVTSPHFTVISDAGDKQALRAAWQFEQVRAVLLRLWPWARVAPGKPFVVFAARDENSLKGLAPQYWETRGGIRPASVFVSGPDRHYVALRSDLSEPDSLQANPYFQSYWSYVYLTLASSIGRDLPLWLARGLSDVFANTIVRDKDLQVGRVVPWHLRTLRDGSRLRLATLLTVDRDSPYMTRNDQAPVFEASAWALVHYLSFGENGANLPRLNRFLELVAAGGDVPTSLTEIYGPIDRLDATVQNYVARTLYTYQLVGLDVNVSAQGFTRRPMPAAESAGARASLLAAMQRPVEARALAQETMRANPALAAPYEVEGALCDQEARQEAALAAYAKAGELGSTNFYAYYRHAQLLWRATSDRATLERMAELLGKSIALNSDWAPGYAFLADTKVDLDDAATALGLARRAAGLEPRVSSHRLTVARALARLSKLDDAVREAGIALALARNPGERGRAEEMLAYLKRLPK